MKKILIVVLSFTLISTLSYAQKIITEEIVPLLKDGKKTEALAALKNYQATAMSPSTASYFLSGKLLYEIAIASENKEDIALATKDLNKAGVYWRQSETASLNKKNIAALMIDPEIDKFKAYQIMWQELDKMDTDLRKLRDKQWKEEQANSNKVESEVVVEEKTDLPILSEEEQDKLTKEFWKYITLERFKEIVEQMPSLANSRNDYGIHALAFYISNGYGSEFIYTLVKYGADINGNIGDKMMPMNSVAAVANIGKGTENDYKIADFLLEKGADPNFNNCLILLAKNRVAETKFTLMIAERLLEAGANKDVKDAYQKTALDYAKEKEKQGLVDLLSK